MSFGNVVRRAQIRRVASRQASFKEAVGRGIGGGQLAALQQPVDVLTLCVKAGTAPPRQRLGCLGARGGGLCKGVGTAQEGEERYHTSRHLNNLLRERCLLEPREYCQPSRKTTRRTCLSRTLVQNAW